MTRSMTQVTSEITARRALLLVARLGHYWATRSMLVCHPLPAESRCLQVIRRARPTGFEPVTFGSVGGRPSNREPRSPRGIACTPPFSGVTRGDTRGHEGTRFVPTWFPPLFPPRGTCATQRPKPRRSRRRPDARRSRCLSKHKYRRLLVVPSARESRLRGDTPFPGLATLSNGALAS